MKHSYHQSQLAIWDYAVASRRSCTPQFFHMDAVRQRAFLAIVLELAYFFAD